MFKNNLKIAVRNLLHHRGHTAINIFGLAIGMAACVLILLYVHNEMTYDTFHKDAEHIYRITASFTTSEGTQAYAKTNNPLAPALLNDYPDIVNAVRLGRGEVRILFGEKAFTEESFSADPAIFDMFSFPLLRGNPKTALNGKNTVVISEEIAQKYFGKEDPMGKNLTFETGDVCTVTGILQKIPENSSLKFDILSPLIAGNFENTWHRYNVWTYVQLSETFPASELEKQFPVIIKKYLSEPQKSRVSYQLQRLTDIHLRSHLLYEIEGNSYAAYCYILLAVGFFILLIACINFMNLSTSRFANRAKEIGVRKVLGAERVQLVEQFLGESILQSGIAAVLGMALAEIFLPVFNEFTGREMVLRPQNAGLSSLLAFLGLALFVGMLSGSYPAFFQSSFRTVDLMKSNLKTSQPNVLFRRALIIMQFSTSVILIIAASVLFRQLRFMKNYDLGFDKAQVVIIPIDLFGYELDEAKGKAGAIRDELIRSSGVISASLCEEIPGHGAARQLSVFPTGWASANPFVINHIAIDDKYLETLGMELVAGRNFSEQFATDVSEAVIINEAAVKAMGWQSALGKEIRGWTGTAPFKVIGVVKDFHFQSLHYAIEPLLYTFRPGSNPSFHYMAVKIRSQNIPSTLESLAEKWHALVPPRPFEYFFLDDEFNQNYQAEEKWSRIIAVASLLAIFIASLGLLGLTSLTVTQKTKEIGVRKVLGATVANVIALLSKDFVKLVVLANLLAWPVAYFAMNKWLQDFVYRVEMGWWVFAIAGGLALLIALLTVSTQAIKAAMANPVEALRYE